MGKLIIDGNSVYEIDEECMRRKEEMKKWEALNSALRQQEMVEENGPEDEIDPAYKQDSPK